MGRKPALGLELQDLQKPEATSAFGTTGLGQKVESKSGSGNSAVIQNPQATSAFGTTGFGQKPQATSAFGTTGFGQKPKQILHLAALALHKTSSKLCICPVKWKSFFWIRKVRINKLRICQTWIGRSFNFRRQDSSPVSTPLADESKELEEESEISLPEESDYSDEEELATDDANTSKDLEEVEGENVTETQEEKVETEVQPLPIQSQYSFLL